MRLIYNEKAFKRIKLTTWFFICTFIIAIAHYVLLLVNNNIENERFDDIVFTANWVLGAIYKVMFLVSAFISMSIHGKSEGKRNHFYLFSVLLIISAAINLIPFDFINILYLFILIFTIGFGHGEVNKAEIDAEIAKRLLFLITIETIGYILLFVGVIILTIGFRRFRKEYPEIKTIPMISNIFLLIVLLATCIVHANGLTPSGLVNYLAFSQPIFNYVSKYLFNLDFLLPLQLLLFSIFILFSLEILIKARNISRKLQVIEQKDDRLQEDNEPIISLGEKEG